MYCEIFFCKHSHITYNRVLLRNCQQISKILDFAPFNLKSNTAIVNLPSIENSQILESVSLRFCLKATERRYVKGISKMGVVFSYD